MTPSVTSEIDRGPMDWFSAIVGTAAGAVAGLGANGFNFWKQTGVNEEKMSVLLSGQQRETSMALAATKTEFVTRIESVEERFRAHVETNERDRRELLNQLQDAAKSLHGAAVGIAAMASEQAVINKVVTQALEGITKRQEAHSQQLMENERRMVDLGRK